MAGSIVNYARKLRKPKKPVREMVSLKAKSKRKRVNADFTHAELMEFFPNDQR